jgi:molybdopterin molybdotransferase
LLAESLTRPVLLSATIRCEPSTRGEAAIEKCAASFGCKFGAVFSRQAGMAPIQRLPASLTPLELALAALLEGIKPVTPVEVALAGALGCVAAEMPPLKAHPPHDIAISDGWALHARDLVGASSYSPLPLSTQPVWVDAGDLMPEGCDCVIDGDCVDQAGPIFQALAEARPGQGVRRIGGDIAEGCAFMDFATGRWVRPLDLMIARAAGLDKLSVRRPRLRIVDIPANSGQAMTAQLIAENARAAGADVVCAEAAGRDTVSVANALDSGACDMLVTIGGSGVGRNDATITALASRGEVLAHGIALEPGRTAAIGRLGHVPVVALPGAPDAALAAWWTLALPLADRLCWLWPRGYLIRPLERKIASSIGIAEVVLLELVEDAFIPLAVADLSLAAIARADAWLAVPSGLEGFAAGALVGAYELRS